MKEYKFRKLKRINTEENFYVCNRMFENDFEPCSFYRKEDVISLLGEFIDTFLSIKQSMREIEEVFGESIKI